MCILLWVFWLFLQVVIFPLAFIEYLTPADEQYFGSVAYWMKVEQGLILEVLPNHRFGGRMPTLRTLNASLGWHRGCIWGREVFSEWIGKELFGALAVRAEPRAGESFKWATQQGGPCVSPLLGAGVGISPPLLLEGTPMDGRHRSSWHVVYLSVHWSHCLPFPIVKF